MKLSEFFETFEPKTDKNTGHCYISQYYCNEFSPKKEDEIKLLEIGIRQGYSHYLWDKYFTNGKIYGIDNGESGFDYTELLNKSRVITFNDNAYSPYFCNTLLDNYFDYIIDDGPHTVESQIKAVELYLPKLKIGGKLIIEDIQSISFVDRIIKNAKNWKLFDLRSVSGRPDDILIEITKK